MSKILRNYFFWTYPRGNFHYDVMVTLILAFIFVTPHLWDYGDKPPQNVGSALPMQVVGDGQHGLVVTLSADAVKVDGKDLDGTADGKTQKKALKKALEPITGDEFFLTKWQGVTDSNGRLTGWLAWVHK